MFFGNKFKFRKISQVKTFFFYPRQTGDYWGDKSLANTKITFFFWYKLYFPMVCFPGKAGIPGQNSSYHSFHSVAAFCLCLQPKHRHSAAIKRAGISTLRTALPLWPMPSPADLILCCRESFLGSHTALPLLLQLLLQVPQILLRAAM